MKVSFFHMVVFFSKFILSKNKLYVIFIYDKKRVNKLKKRILTLLISFFFIPIYVYADSSLILLCPEEVLPDSEFSCTLKGTSQTPVTSINASIDYHENLELLYFINLDYWEGKIVDSSIQVNTTIPTSDSFDIALIKFRNIGNIGTTLEIDINNIIFYDENNQEINTENIHKSILVNNRSTADEDSVVESSPYLSNIQIDGRSINFAKSIYEYSVTINEEKNLSIFPVLENFDDTFEIINNNNLDNGSRVEIIVKNKDGYHRSYFLNIIKENNLNDETKINNDYTYIFIIIIVLLVIINIIRIVKRKKINNK